MNILLIQGKTQVYRKYRKKSLKEGEKNDSDVMEKLGVTHDYVNMNINPWKNSIASAKQKKMCFTLHRVEQQRESTGDSTAK